LLIAACVALLSAPVGCLGFSLGFGFDSTGLGGEILDSDLLED
jgi:hypothetical protein